MFCVLFLLFIFSNTGKIPNGNPHIYLLSSLKSVAWSINHFVMTALKRVTHPRRNQEKHLPGFLEPRCVCRKIRTSRFKDAHDVDVCCRSP
jgi:hypothetical protein